jgi:hypothetical protein
MCCSLAGFRCATTYECFQNTETCIAAAVRLIGERVVRYARGSAADTESKVVLNAARCGGCASALGAPLRARPTRADRLVAVRGNSFWPKHRLPLLPNRWKGKRKKNKAELSLAQPSRGGRVAKGGRLKICSRRSSQVQILAPA